MARTKLGSIGRLLPTLEARIIDAEGNDVAESEPGEMALRGPTIMRYASKKQDMLGIQLRVFMA
jgi:non-ribosomal peptide synthetase component E (peptide arylation enzyme)